MTFRFSYILAALLATPAMAANPLTPAEETVCRTLSHCLSIVDDHPYDSFDYDVLAGEFSRFGSSGLRALIKRVDKGGRQAGHAADLLADIADPQTLPGLQRIAQGGEDSAPLAHRTIEAIRARQTTPPAADPLEDHPDPLEDRPDLRKDQDERCFSPAFDPWGGRMHAMPYFETRIATADPYGAYRPSAAFRFKTASPTAPQYKSRAWLRSAERVSGGWMAAYPDALIHYDSQTGAPTMLAERCFLSVQSRELHRPSNAVWAFSPGPEGGLDIWTASLNNLELTTRLTSPPTALRRLESGGLCLFYGNANSLHLKPDGTIDTDCQGPDATP